MANRNSTDLPTNEVFTADNVATLSTFPDACIDLVVTSPPYDNLRTYGGHTWDFEGVARELTRVLKPGGVIVWVVADATVNGSETLTSMRQAIHFKDVCGLRVHDTMIYQKPAVPFDPKCARYWQCWEYMFVFSKDKPKCNYLKEPCKGAGKKKTGDYGQKRYDGTNRTDRHDSERVILDEKVRNNIWFYTAGCARVAGHPAQYPLDLARDHILSWSNEGDVVLDPFAGSGTTLVAAKETGRRYVGIEINSEYVQIINRRLGSACSESCEIGVDDLDFL